MHAKIHTALRDLRVRLEGQRLINMGQLTYNNVHIGKPISLCVASALTYVIRAEQAFLSGRYKRAQSHLNKAWMEFYQNHLNTDLVKPALDISDALEVLFKKQKEDKQNEAKSLLDGFFEGNFGFDCQSAESVQHGARFSPRALINDFNPYTAYLNVPHIVAGKGESIDPFADFVESPFTKALQKAVRESLKDAMNPVNAPLTDEQVNYYSTKWPNSGLGRACTELTKNRKLIAELQKLLRG